MNASRSHSHSLVVNGCAIFLILICVNSAFAQTAATRAAVDEYVKAEMQRQHIPGLSLLVVKDGKNIVAEGYGLANVELQVPVKPETVFQSGSVGKQFTATAVMMLVEEGKIGLDDPLDEVFSRRAGDLERRDGARTAQPHRRVRRLSERTSTFARTGPRMKN